MDKKYVWVVVVAAIIVVAYTVVNQMQQSNLPSGTMSPSSIVSATPGMKKGSVKQNPVVSAKNYSDLVKEYEGRRIQFDKNCQMTPSYVTYKNGTSIMLDNRSTDTKDITIGSNKYSLIGYGYRIVTLSSAKIPSEVSFNCGSAVNVGKALLQALILH